MDERFQVDLRGIIDLAANHLYSSPDVFVREVIQNAVDAITARQRIDASFRGRVRLELTSPDDGPAILCIADDGIGLTTGEVHAFLSTVGGSSKREDAEAIAEGAPGYLGRFGIGLLSCFMVSEEIVVVTRSARDRESPAVEWRGRSDGRYTVRELPDLSCGAGTSVYLTAQEHASEYFERDRLIELARQFAEMLGHPIVVVTPDGEVPINLAAPPWTLEDEQELAEFCARSLGFQPLDVFPLSAPAGGVTGHGFIRPDRASTWSKSHRLYSNGMFVSEHVPGLLPRWATFLGCVLNSDQLRLTASRESVHHDESLEKTEEQLGSAIRGRLARLLRSNPERFASVMAAHDTEIRGLGVRDQEFFDVIIDLLEFETTLGCVRFGEYRREHERLLVARTAEQYRRLFVVAGAQGTRVFNGGYTYHEELLARAAERHPELEVRAFDTADLAEILPEADDAEAFGDLLDAARAALEDRGCEAVIRDFAPADVCAFYALGLDAEFHRQVDRTKSMASGLWKDVLDAMATRENTAAPTRLCLNARNPLVRRLACLKDADLLRTAIEVVYVQTLMAGQHPLRADEIGMLNRGLERLLASATEHRT